MAKGAKTNNEKKPVTKIFKFKPANQSIPMLTIKINIPVPKSGCFATKKNGIKIIKRGIINLET